MHDWFTNDTWACHKYILLLYNNFHSGKASTVNSICFAQSCYFLSTFRRDVKQVRHLNESMLQKQAIPHPGIGPVLPSDEVRYHAYYQWVPFILFAQAISFYLPHLFWRSWEGGKIKSLVVGLQMILLTKHLEKEEDLQINKSYVIYSKPTIEKKVRNRW